MAISEAAERRLAEYKEKRALRKKQRKADQANMFTPGREVVWRPQPGPQTALVTCPHPEILFGGARGGGKGQSLDAKVVTPFGFKLMGDLKVGSAVCNPDGSVARVIDIYELGQRQLYCVMFSDGTSTEVTGDHIWLAWRANKTQKRNGQRISGEQSAQLWTTEEMIRAMTPERRFLIPITHPVSITDVARYPRRPVPPYLVGVLLGDGTFTTDRISFSKPDREIAERLRIVLSESGYSDSLDGPFEYNNRCEEWVVRGGATRDWLRKVGLFGLTSLEKFIPETYLLGSVDERWELLRGLFDTDGWSEEDGDIYYGTSSPRLRDDVALLARSLGASVTVRQKDAPTYNGANGEKLTGSTAWTLRVKLRDPSMAFTLPRKRERCTRSPQSMNRTIVSIEKTRVAPSRCIRVSHPNGLYLTNDYIVTHNTDGVLGAWLYHAGKYGENARGIIFRRRFKQLEALQDRCAQLFPKLGALYNKGDALWLFPNGASIKLRHLWDEAACEEYQGHNYTYMVFEEATNWSSMGPIDKMRATLRSAHGVPTKMILTANPGGSGHNVIKMRYISPARNGFKPIEDPETGEVRVFIPSRLENNEILMRNDPFYERRLMQSGNSAIVKAWRYGDWDIVAGGFFDDLFNPDKHLLQPFDIPPTWRWRRSFDWGSAAPASLGIWAISDGTPVPDMDGFVFPRGSVIRVSEWYTVARDSQGIIRPNEGLRLTNIALGNGVAIRSQDHSFSGCVADPSIFAKPGRDSIYDEMQKGAKELGHHLIFQPADNNRIAGWQRMRDMLEAATAEYPEKPGLYAFETCEHYARTLPVMQRDDSKPDDIDTDQEDHVCDDVRYLCATGARTLSIGTRLGE